LDGFFGRSNIIAPRLYIIEERHETVVHVQLLVAVDVGVIRIKCPIDAAPLAKAGECRRQLSATDDSLLPKTRLPARLESRRARVQT